MIQKEVKNYNVTFYNFVNKNILQIAVFFIFNSTKPYFKEIHSEDIIM